jgi:plastocyanin
MTFLRLAAALLIGIGVIGGTACSNSTDGGGGGGGGGHTTNITVGNNFFSPTPDTVPAGIVTFTWSTPSNGHNVTWSTGPGALPASSTPDDKASGTYQATLQAGTYTYHCTRHSSMNGTIVVQ